MKPDPDWNAKSVEETRDSNPVWTNRGRCSCVIPLRKNKAVMEWYYIEDCKNCHGEAIMPIPANELYNLE